MLTNMIAAPEVQKTHIDHSNFLPYILISLGEFSVSVAYNYTRYHNNIYPILISSWIPYFRVGRDGIPVAVVFPTTNRTLL